MSVAAVYTALAAIDITFRGSVLPVRWGATLEATLPAAQLPLRILLPWKSAGVEARSITPTTIGGGNSSAEIIVNDTFMWKPLPQGLGLEEHLAALYEYEPLYHDAIKQRVGLIKPSTTVTSWSISLGMTEYPIRSGVWYSSCICEVRVKELR
jgi:hypothetical protein